MCSGVYHYAKAFKVCSGVYQAYSSHWAKPRYLLFSGESVVALIKGENEKCLKLWIQHCKEHPSISLVTNFHQN